MLVYANGVIKWRGTVLASTFERIIWPVQIAADAPAGGSIVNTAMVNDSYGCFETDPAVLLLRGGEYRIHLPLIVSTQ